MTSSSSPGALLDEAVASLAAGDAEAARRACDRVLARDPDHPSALALSATLLAMAGDPAGAIPGFQRAIALGGANPDWLHNLGLAQERAGFPAAAAQSFVGVILRTSGHAPAHAALGRLYARQGVTDDAIAALRRAVEFQPDAVDVRLDLAALLSASGQAVQAFLEYRALSDRHPAVDRFRFLAGTAALAADDLEQAEHLLRQALLRMPRDAGLLNNLALCLSRQGKVSDAVFFFRQATGLQPDYAAAWFGLAAALEKGSPGPEADDAYGKVLALLPDDPGTWSNRLMMLNYRADLSPADRYARHRAWGARLSTRVGAPLRPAAAPLAGRRLRIGYVSADLRAHSIAMFLLPLLDHHDRTRVELFAYADVERADGVTHRIRSRVDGWRDIRGWSDEAVAEAVREDRIDLLIDLAGHTAGNRLGVFSRRPAPAQATWLGYPATTGLSAIDARFTDAVADPRGQTDDWHSEQLVRLDGGFLCYHPFEPAPPVPPAAEGPITFGSFNLLAKLTPQVAALWARVLHAVPNSRLLLKSAPLVDRAVRRRIEALFGDHGIPRSRLDLRPHLPSGTAHLDLYGAVDIALDPFPYNGTTTTCEALWMGVPVLTLPGDHHAARVGASLLTAAGLSELIATDADDFVEQARALAADHDRRTEWRRTLRTQLQSSRLCDASAFAREFERRCFELVEDCRRQPK